MSEYLITSPTGQEMATYQPPIYNMSVVMQSYLQATGSEFDLVYKAINEVLNQFYVRTATWSLDKWEQELNLSPIPGLTDQERQDRVVSKVSGFGTCTIVVAKTVAESFKNGAIDVAEDYSSYTVTIYFVDVMGIPSNEDDLKKALREVVPAHLEISYVYKYFLFDDLDTKGWTLNDLDALGLTFDQLEVYK